MLKKMIFPVAGVLLLVVSFVDPFPASAETFVGAGLGISMVDDVDDLKATNNAGYTATSTAFSPEDSVAWGGKAGYYFSRFPWFGFEFNFYNRDPDVEQQGITVTITGTPTGLFSGRASGDFRGRVDVDNLTTYGFQFLLRPTEDQIKAFLGGNIEPFVGLGFAVNVLDVNKATLFNTAGTELASTSGDSDTAVGILVTGGINYKVTDRVKFFGEFKYTQADYTFGGWDSGLEYTLSGTDKTVMFGLTYTLEGL